MYCPNCGKAVDQNLKYCNTCGERLSKAAEIDKDGTPGKMLDNILTTLFLVVMFGLGILVGLVAILLGSGVKTDAIFGIILAWLTAIFGICFSLARQATKLVDFKMKGWSTDNDAPAARELRPLTTAQLDEYREPLMSVTDHTTQTLDKVPIKNA